MKLTRTLMSICLGAACGIAGIDADAQTTANGPYYATPSWDQTMPAASRFVVLTNFNSEAVLDRETGLVWQRTPQHVAATTVHAGALTDCATARTGGRAGWRVPTIYELGSLFDPANFNALPPISPGHPFMGFPASGNVVFWSTANVSGPNLPGHIAAGFFSGELTLAFILSDATPASLWCVRGQSSSNSD